MARRRMFSLDVVDTDRFACMSKDARYLYYELGVRADDDGFIGSPMRIIKMTESTTDDLKELTNNGFIIKFNTGIIVIKDWLQNNQIRKDRYTETVYTKEKQQISIDESTKEYVLNDNQTATNGLPTGIPNGNQMATNGLPDKSNNIEKESKDKDFGLPNGNQRFPQDRVGKSSIDKDSDKTSEYLTMFKITLVMIDHLYILTLITFVRCSMKSVNHLSLLLTLGNILTLIQVFFRLCNERIYGRRLQNCI